MAVLYVTSSEEGVGKTAICAGVGRYLRSDGKKIGFLKLRMADEAIDSDASFMKHILALEESVESICPIIGAGGIKEAYARVSQGKDVVIVEGMPIESSYKIVEALDASVIIVEDYSKGLPDDKLIDSSKQFGRRFLGVVLNKVPGNQLEAVRNELSIQSGEAEINILGVLPEDRVLFTLTVGELAEHLQGELLSSADKSTELVENFMLGAMYVDHGPEYFARKNNKAVVLRGDRPDMQMAALETSTRCLILSGNTSPIPTVRHRAEDKKVPIILVKGDVTATAQGLEDALDKTRFNQEKKLPRLTETMQRHFNYQAVYQGLRLAS